jgi:hypothetical protein
MKCNFFIGPVSYPNHISYQGPGQSDESNRVVTELEMVDAESAWPFRMERPGRSAPTAGGFLIGMNIPK